MEDQNIFFKKDPISQNELKKLSELANKQIALELEIKKCESKIEDLKKDLKLISQEEIPALLLNAGLSEIRLATGEKIEVKDELKASISEANKEAAYNNMITISGKGHVDDLFKTKIIIDQPTESVKTILIKEGIPYENKRDIHWQTLRKYCTDLLKEGTQIPEGISVFTYKITKIK